MSANQVILSLKKVLRIAFFDFKSTFESDTDFVDFSA